MSAPGDRILHLSDEVQETIRSLHPDLKRRIPVALDELHRRPERGKPLVGELSGWRTWRVGRFRIVYRERRRAIEVAALGPRAEIYLDAARRLR